MTVTPPSPAIPPLQEEVEAILEAYGNAIYYDNDPKRGGISSTEAMLRLFSIINRERKKAVEEALWKYHHGESKNAADVLKVVSEMFPLDQ